MDKMHGHGVYLWPDGAMYEGDYREHKKHGYGVQTWASGGRYEGEYVDGQLTGKGKMSWADGRRYEGEWLDGKCTGRGITTFANGSRYEGIYHEDKMHGYGVYTFADGRRYEGEYRNNMKNGYGVYTWSEGTRWEGEWVDGKPMRGFVIFADGVRTDELLPRDVGHLTNDMTLQLLHEDATEWKRQYDDEHGISNTMHDVHGAAAAPSMTPVGTADEDHVGSMADLIAQTDQMMTQPGAYAGVALTHGPTVAGAMEDTAMDEMPDAALDIVRRDGEPSQGLMNEGAWEDEDGGGRCAAGPAGAAAGGYLSRVGKGVDY